MVPKLAPRPARPDPKRCPEHLAWIRTLPCCAYPCGAQDVQAHHVRVRSRGGTGVKPGDEWTIPLCNEHHREGHDHGWRTFETKYAIDLREIALELAASSPSLLNAAFSP